jgi:hypothetical protein
MDLIPEEYKHELMAIRERSKDDSWRIGDITNEIIAMVRARGIAVSKDEIYRQVSNECGRPARTVRYYARIAGFYSADARMEYDILSFEHFRVATGKSNWQAILDDAVDGVEEKGRPRTVEYIERKYIYGAETTAELVEDEDYNETAIQIDAEVDNLLSMVNYSRLPGETKERMRNAILALKNILEEVLVSVRF